MDALFNALFILAAIGFVLWFAFGWGAEFGKGRAQNERCREPDEQAKRKERESSEALRPKDAVAKEMPPAQTSTKRQPSSKEFWGAERAEPEDQLAVKQAEDKLAVEQAMRSLLRTVPISDPKRANESAEKQSRDRKFRDVLTEVSKPLPVAIALDGLLPSCESLIDVGVVKEKWQPLVEFAKNAKQQAKSCCDLKLLRQVRSIAVNCDLKSLLQPVCGTSVIGDASFAMEIQSQYGPIDFDGFCDAIALKDGARLPFEQGLRFETSLDGALAAFFIQVVLPGHWAWGHGMYDRDQQLVTTLDAAIAILQQSRISPENPELRNMTTPPGTRVSRRDDTIEVGCLIYRPGKGFSDIVVTIEGGRLSKTQERVLFHWSHRILY
jgi:hypothetical protein